MTTPKKKQRSPQSSQSGFTIVESLMAIVVVGILMTALAPVITLSVASRVQARRVELATQAARAYVDGLRSGIIDHPPSITGNLEDYTAPTSSGSLDCKANSYCSSPDLYCVVLYGNSCTAGSRIDMLVQAFRLNSASTDANKGYSLGLRVYRADAFSDNTALKTQKQTGIKQATFTGGLGNRKAPLIEMTTEIFVTDRTTYQDYCKRLDGCEQ